MPRTTNRPTMASGRISTARMVNRHSSEIMIDGAADTGADVDAGEQRDVVARAEAGLALAALLGQIGLPGGGFGHGYGSMGDVGSVGPSIGFSDDLQCFAGDFAHDANPKAWPRKRVSP